MCDMAISSLFGFVNALHCSPRVPFYMGRVRAPESVVTRPLTLPMSAFPVRFATTGGSDLASPSIPLSDNFRQRPLTIPVRMTLSASSSIAPFQPTRSGFWASGNRTGGFVPK